MIDEIEKTFRWLKQDQVGCMFAKALAIEKYRERWRVLAMPTPSEIAHVATINETLIEASNQSDCDAAILVFPEVETLDDLVGLFNVLCEHDSWSSREDKFPDKSQGGHDRIGVGIRWVMPCKSESFALGFGPFGFMPPTRRSPYTAITLPVCEKGVHRKGDSAERHLCDMANDIWTLDKFNDLWSKTEKMKAEEVSEFDSNAAKAKVTFSIPETCREKLSCLSPVVRT